MTAVGERSAPQDARLDLQERRGIGPRALLVGVLLTIGAAVWVAQVELILHTAEISESVPLIASIAGLLALVVWNRALDGVIALADHSRPTAGAAVFALGVVTWLLSIPAGGGLAAFLVVVALLLAASGAAIAVNPRAREMVERGRLRRREVVLVYCFLTLSALMMSAKVSGYLIPEMTIYTYFGFDNPDFEQAGRVTPGWLALKDPNVVRTLYEGSDLDVPPGLGGGAFGAIARATEGLWWPMMQVPWGAWLVPIAVWTAIMFLVLAAGLCLLALMKRYWMEKERLSFPLVMIPLELSSAADRTGRSAFLRDPGFWIGFALSGTFTLFVVMHAVSPGLPMFRPYYDLRPLFSEHPWRAVQDASIQVRPEMMGLSYFMDSDIILTIWVMTIVNSLLAVGTTALGYETRDFPRPFDQGVGAYVVLAIFLVWAARVWLGRGIGLAAQWRASSEGRRYLALWVGLLGSLGALLAPAIAAGMTWWVAAYLFGITLVFMLVYGRARAETGVPHPSPFPSGGQMRVLEYIGGPGSWAGGATPALLGSFFFLGRGYTITASGAEIENLKIAEQQGVRERSMAWLTLIAPVVGLLIAFVMRLSVSYHYGLNTLEGGVVQGGYAVTQMRTHATQMIGEAALGVGRAVAPANAAAFGAVVTVTLIALRRMFLRFPLHPLGYCLAMVRLRSFWAPIMVTWLIKTLLLKVGGARAYRRAAPAFMGLAIGHYFFAGIGLGVLAAAFPRLLAKIEVINFD